MLHAVQAPCSVSHTSEVHAADVLILSALCCPCCTGSMFVLSLFDKMWHPNLTEAEALNMMELGIAEVKTRLAMAPTAFNIKVGCNHDAHVAAWVQG